MTQQARALLLFNHDWDAVGHARAASARGMAWDQTGFDLFSFPSNARLAGFDIQRWVDRLATKARSRGWQAVSSQHEQFGALAAALLAERMGWPGTPVAAILACQHKLHARQVLQQVAPEANIPFELMDAEYGAPIRHGIDYPRFVKPVKAAFSVLARTVHNHADLHRHTRFGAWELWVIRRLVEPFERLAQQRLQPCAPAAKRPARCWAGGSCSRGAADAACGVVRVGLLPVRVSQSHSVRQHASRSAGTVYLRPSPAPALRTQHESAARCAVRGG